MKGVELLVLLVFKSKITPGAENTTGGTPGKK
jgi:hypothetical protein